MDDKDQKALAVYNGMLGFEPPRDAAGRIINYGDWVIQAVTMGKVAGLKFGRAFPAQNLEKVKRDRGKKGRDGDKNVPVRTFCISTDLLGYDRGKLTASTAVYNFRMLVIPREVVPPDIQAILDHTPEELAALMKEMKDKPWNQKKVI